jgi:hypothetical protein
MIGLSKSHLCSLKKKFLKKARLLGLQVQSYSNSKRYIEDRTNEINAC